MSIRLKILVACLCLTAITIASGVLARASQSELGGLAFRLYDDAFMSMSYLRSAQNTLLSISRDLAAPVVEGQSSVDEKMDSAVSDLQVAHDRALSPQGAKAATWLQEQVAMVQQQVRSGQPARHSVLSNIEEHFDSAVEINAGDGFRFRREAVGLIAHVKQQTWVVMAISVTVALVITVLLSRAIVPSVRYAVGIATNIASGRLDNPIAVTGSGETGVLLRALGTMQRSIADKMAQIERLMAQQASNHATEIAAQHLRFEVALENMVQGLCMIDAERRIIVHNRRFAEMFGETEVGAPLLEALPTALVLTQAADQGASSSYSRTLDDDRIIAVSERPMSAGGWVVTYDDVTERHRSEARLAHMARHDMLTGLPNRLSFQEQTDTALAELRDGEALAVLCLNLDHFKAINDSLGHSFGDALLCEVANRLNGEVGEQVFVARLGGDEFGVLQTSQDQPTSAKKLAERLSTIIAEISDINGERVAVTISTGIAIQADESGNAETLLKNAGLALYRAKSDGRDTFRFFESAMDALMQARRALEIDLREAIELKQFVVYYQPLVTTRTGQVSGFEALVRWPHPSRGLVSPIEFISVAEETGLIGRLGALVMEQACMDAVNWPESIKVAVNLSPLQFKNANLASDVADILERTGLPPHRLELEVTESVLLQDSDAILALLHKIRSFGVRVSMDDFGTGYSSLSYLRRFPFDKIKIDQSFIRTLDDSNDCLAIVRAVLGLGRSLGMSVVAEGVETLAQFDILKREGCEQLQGYLFSKPQPIAVVPSIIARCAERQVELV